MTLEETLHGFRPCKLSKTKVLDAIRAVRALEEIAIMPVGIN